MTTSGSQFAVIENGTGARPTTPPEPKTTAAEPGVGDGAAVATPPWMNTPSPLVVPDLPDGEDGLPLVDDADVDPGLTVGTGVLGCWVGRGVDLGAGGRGVGGGGGGVYTAAAVLGGEYAHGALHADTPWPAPLFGFCCALLQSMLPALGVNARASHAWNRI